MPTHRLRPLGRLAPDVSEPALPRYSRRQEVPRDLRSADALAERGYHDLGPIRALLVAHGREIGLYSTSEARARRDGMWRRATNRSATPSASLDPMSAPARGPTTEPGEAVTGACTGCGRRATGVIGGLCPACRSQQREAARRERGTAWVQRLLRDDFVVLDTETTGLGGRDEVIEVGVVDGSGATLLETLVWPRRGRVPEGATYVHGLTLADLDGAPTWPAVLPQLQALLRGRRILAWNAPFDERMLQQTSRLWGLRHDLPAFECAMRAYAMARGLATGRRKLAVAATESGVMRGTQRHRSADDARLTLAVLASLDR